MRLESRSGSASSRLFKSVMRRVAAMLVSSATLQATMPAASAQVFEPVPQDEAGSQQLGISVHAQVDILYMPPGATTPILAQKTFETRASAVNLSSQYVFDVLNDAVLEGVDQALANGAQTGRVSVVAVCYSYGLDGQVVQGLAPMGVFINTTDLSVQANGVASLRTHVKVVPPPGSRESQFDVPIESSDLTEQVFLLGLLQSQRIEQSTNADQRHGCRTPVCRNARRVCPFGSMQCSAGSIAGRERRNQHRADGGRQYLQHGQSQNQIA